MLKSVAKAFIIKSSRQKLTMAWNFFQFCSGLKIIGSVMILVFLAIVGVTYYSVVLTAYGPQLLTGNAFKTLIAIFVLLIFHVLLVLLLWSYFATVFCDPGSVPSGWMPRSSEDEMESQTESISTNEEPYVTNTEAIPEDSSLVGRDSASISAPSGIVVRKCRKCDCWKPPRSHHCSICRRCVLKMDHHCVWVVNCVGAKNYKFFLLFIVYTFLETTFTTIALVFPFLDFFLHNIETADPTPAAAVFFSFVLNLSFSLSLLGFLIMHTRFVLSNTTTIETMEKRRGEVWKYDLGRVENFQQVFGESPLHWFFPLYSQEDLRRMTVLTGLEYPVNTVSLDGHL